MSKYEDAYIVLVDYIADLKDSYKKEDLKAALLVIKELIRRDKTVFTVVDRAVDYIYTEMQPYTAVGDEITRWDREYIREWLWDDDEWK